MPRDINDVMRAGGASAVVALPRKKRENARAIPPVWGDELARTPDGTKLQAIAGNVALILQHDTRWTSTLGFDEMRQAIIWLKTPPEVRGLKPPVANDTMGETDWVAIQHWLLLTYGVKFNREAVEMGAMTAALARKIHPIRDYLDSLTWDGTPRLDTMLIRHAGASNSAWVRAVTAKTLIAAVARAHEPGAKVDTVLVLEGEQGRMKSSMLSALAGEQYFSDNLGDVSHKDAQIHLNGKWIIEIAELDAIRKADNSRTKSFISRQVDQYRPPYGRRDVYVPRSCIFIGTTNSSEYLTDASGGRRFWPVEIPKRIELNAIRAERDQLWAEADARYRGGEAWHLDDELERDAAIEQERRYRPHPWEDVLREKLTGKHQTTFAECLDLLGIEVSKQTHVHSNEIAKTLKRIGFKQGPRTTGKDPNTGKNTRPRLYVLDQERPESEPVEEDGF